MQVLDDEEDDVNDGDGNARKYTIADEKIGWKRWNE